VKNNRRECVVGKYTQKSKVKNQKSNQCKSVKSVGGKKSKTIGENAWSGSTLKSQKSKIQSV
ncbi:MAG: hypothetical protein J7D60_05825, partial [Prosthecochloris sp.]|nr:hypothetical protein [Prosthecochloris sp.]